MKRLALGALLLATGCSDATGNGSAVAVSLNEAWAGSPVILTSDAFTGADTLPVSIRAGTNTLFFIPFGPNKVDVLMPQEDGVYALEIELHDGRLLRTGDIRVHGLLGAAPGPAVSGRVQPAYGYARPTGMAYGAFGRLTVVNFKTGATAPLGTVADLGFGDECLPGVMPSAANPSVTTVGRLSPLGSCSVLAATVNTRVTVLDSTSVQGSDVHPSMYLGAGRWIVGRQDSMVIATGPASRYAFACNLQDIVAAPSPGLAVVPVGCDIAGGVPVFDRTTGLPQFVLGNVRQVTAAAFSPHGDTLYYAGVSTGGSPQSSLYAADPVSGAILDAIPIPPVRAFSDMTSDPNGPWLFLADGDLAADSVEVTVFDRATLDVVAVWHAENQIKANQLGLWRLMVGTERVLYLVATRLFPAAGSYVYRWALLN